MTTPNLRALCATIIELWDADCDIDVEINELRELLATPPPEPPTDEEILELMPEEMRAEFSNTAKLYSTATHGQVEPGIFRVVLNTMALEYARAVLERWGK